VREHRHTPNTHKIKSTANRRLHWLPDIWLLSSEPNTNLKTSSVQPPKPNFTDIHLTIMDVKHPDMKTTFHSEHLLHAYHSKNKKFTFLCGRSTLKIATTTDSDLY
jgi:hypothetical protein